MLGRVLDLKPGEGRLLVRLGGHLFLLLLSTTAYVAVAETLFLASHPARLLPWTYLAGAGSSLLLTLGYGRLRARLGPAALTRAVTLGTTLLLALLWTLIEASTVVGAFVLQVGATGVTVLAGLESAEWIARTLDTRAARRLYPLIGGLGGIGATLGALLVAWLSARVPVVHLLGLTLLATLAAGRLVVGLPLAPRARARVAPAAWSSVLAAGFPRLLLLLTFLAAMIAITARQQMLAVLQTTLEKEQRARFLGLLYGGLNAASIGFGLLLARPLIKRLGVSAALAIYPLLIVGLATLSLGVPTLAVAALTLCCERLFRQNLQRPLLNIAVLPLPSAVASRATLALRGAIENPAVALASLCMLAIPEAVRRPVLGVGLLASGAAALALSLRVRRGYARELVQALQARRLRVEPGEGPPLPLEAGARRLLLEQLASESPDRVGTALDLLDGRADEATVAVVRARWPTWTSGLRARAVGALSRSPAASAGAFLAALTDDEPSEVGAARARHEQAPVPLTTLERWAAEPASPRCAAALVRLVQLRGHAVLEPTLSRWLASGNPQEAEAAAEVLVGARPADYAQRLAGVAHAAPAQVLAALAAQPDAALAPWLAGQLADDARAPQARKALLRLGTAAVPALRDAAQDPQRSSGALSALVEIGGAQARAAVLAGLTSGDPEQRYRAARALEQAGGRPDPAERAQLEDALERELAQAEEAAWMEGSACAAEQAERLAEVDDALGRALALLAALDPSLPLRRVMLALRSGLASERGFAVEALDELVPPPWRARAVALAERTVRRPDAPPRSTGSWGARLARARAAPASEPHLARALAWQGVEPFRRWRLAELEALSQAAALGATEGPGFVIGPTQALGLEAALLESAPAPPGASGERLPLRAVWDTITRRPRLAGAWLAGLAARLPPPAPGAADVSRSLPSLAGRRPESGGDAPEDGDVLSRAFHLRLVAPFSELPASRLRLLAEIAREMPVRAGERIVAEGRQAGHAYVVVRGSVEVRTGGALVATLTPGEAFGVLALLSDAPRTASVTSCEDGEVLALSRLDVRDLLEVHPGLVRSFSRWIAGRVREVDRARGG